MNHLAPLAVAVPLIAAGVLAGTASIANRLFADVASLATGPISVPRLSASVSFVI